MTNKHKFQSRAVSEGVKYIDQECIKCGAKTRKYKSSRTYFDINAGKYCEDAPPCKIETTDGFKVNHDEIIFISAIDSESGNYVLETMKAKKAQDLCFNIYYRKENVQKEIDFQNKL